MTHNRMPLTNRTISGRTRWLAPRRPHCKFCGYVENIVPNVLPIDILESVASPPTTPARLGRGFFQGYPEGQGVVKILVGIAREPGAEISQPPDGFFGVRLRERARGFAVLGDAVVPGCPVAKSGLEEYGFQTVVAKVVCFRGRDVFVPAGAEKCHRGGVGSVLFGAGWQGWRWWWGHVGVLLH